MMATSTGGSATGQGGDRVVIDDPQNPQDAHSEAKRLSANRFFDETLSTRLNDKSTGAFVLIMQRLHQSDLTGHVLDEGGWIHVRVPAIAEVDETVVFPRSGRVVTRKTGELLWEAREDTAQIERVKRRLGSYGFAGQYQQRPTPAEGGMVKREWLRYWTLRRRADDPPDVVELPESLTGHRQSWDMGLWGEARDDYTVGLVGARAGANVYVLDGIRERLGLPGCIAALHTLTARNCRATRKVIEKAANGSEVARRLAGTVPGIIALPPRGSKEARLAAATPMIEAGNVFLPHPREAGWMADCIEELVSFPFAEHDDFTDALSQLVNDFANNAGGASSAGFGGGLDIGGTT
jgi:predicted phage terminase large subunit-like protein